MFRPVHFVSVGDVTISDTEKLVVYSVNSLRAMTPEGAKRCIELRGNHSVFFRLPDIFAGDVTKLEIYYYPREKLVRLHDQGILSNSAQHIRECLLDLEEYTLFAIMRDANGVVYACKLSWGCREPKDVLPKESMSLFGKIYPDVIRNINSPLNPVINGMQAVIINDEWTRNHGDLLGIVPEK